MNNLLDFEETVPAGDHPPVGSPSWQKHHCRYFHIAGITIEVSADRPFAADTFQSKFRAFQAKGPTEDTVTIRHRFTLPDIDGRDLGREVYRRAPWAICKRDDAWIYLGILHSTQNRPLHCLAVFSPDHGSCRIYSPDTKAFAQGHASSLTLFPSDQILLARLLANRQGCYLHSSAVILDGKGLVFAGHSEAGKSTMAGLLKDTAEILCDDRNIIRRQEQSFRVFGTWSHGDLPLVSSSSAPLAAILFLQQAAGNRLVAVKDKKTIVRRLLAYVVRPFVTDDWWENTLSLVDAMSAEVPCYTVEFDKSGRILDLLRRL